MTADTRPSPGSAAGPVFCLSVVVALLLLIVDPNPDYPLRLTDVEGQVAGDIIA